MPLYLVMVDQVPGARGARQVLMAGGMPVNMPYRGAWVIQETGALVHIFSRMTRAELMEKKLFRPYEQ